MDQQRFDALRAAGYNHIPVVKELLADLDTPLSIYLKLADAPHSFLLESVEGGETWGRYSIIGLPARTTIRYADGEFCVCRDDQEDRRRCDDPLIELDKLRRQFREIGRASCRETV